ncbi:MAG TPA: class I SAM-dependent methyltransferase [Deltaproteobacteria bacterium]|nr:class I SAM-dependent methyltransferase [Deltaproteobacteria bacterium]
MSDAPGDVAAYYEQNTRMFLRFGRTGDIGAIHRELWAPGVGTVAEAVDHAHVLIGAQLPEIASPRILDLGCGVGGSLCQLLLQRRGEGVGLTISPTQAGLARQRAEAAGLADRCTFLCGDFTDPPKLEPFDLAFAIESFVHGPDPARFFQAAAGLLRPGGRLVVIDDVLSPSPPPEAARHLDAFRRGWRVSSLEPPDALRQHAEQAGLTCVGDQDLTPWLRLWRWRDRAVAVAVVGLGWLPIPHPYWASLTGGHALQVCLSRGWLTYRMVLFERPRSSDPKAPDS